MDKENKHYRRFIIFYSAFFKMFSFVFVFYLFISVARRAKSGFGFYSISNGLFAKMFNLRRNKKKCEEHAERHGFMCRPPCSLFWNILSNGRLPEWDIYVTQAQHTRTLLCVVVQVYEWWLSTGGSTLCYAIRVLHATLVRNSVPVCP